MLRYIILIIQFCCHLLLMSGLHLQNCPDSYLISAKLFLDYKILAGIQIVQVDIQMTT